MISKRAINSRFHAVVVAVLGATVTLAVGIAAPGYSSAKALVGTIECGGHSDPQSTPMTCATGIGLTQAQAEMNALIALGLKLFDLADCMCEECEGGGCNRKVNLEEPEQVFVFCAGSPGAWICTACYTGDGMWQPACTPCVF